MNSNKKHNLLKSVNFTPITYLFVFLMLAMAACQNPKPKQESDIVEPECAFLHKQSGTCFPTECGGLTFRGTRQYDEDGFDMSAAYESAEGTELTHYIYPFGRGYTSTDYEFQYSQDKNTILSTYENAECFEEGKTKYSGHEAEYGLFTVLAEFHGEKQVLNSYLYIFHEKEWYCMIRVSFPADQKKICDKQVDSYLTNMAWPEIKCKY